MLERFEVAHNLIARTSSNKWDSRGGLKGVPPRSPFPDSHGNPFVAKAPESSLQSLDNQRDLGASSTPCSTVPSGTPGPEPNTRTLNITLLTFRALTMSNNTVLNLLFQTDKEANTTQRRSLVASTKTSLITKTTHSR